MIQSGSFMYKVNLYNYCERYLIAFESVGYGELAIHSAPISMLMAPLMIFSFILPEKIMVKVTPYYSYFMYWLENIIFIIAFLVVEILMVFPVYAKNIF